MGYEKKLEQLTEIVKGFDQMAVAFSGGVDSTFLLSVGKAVLGSNVIAVTASGPIFAPDESAFAASFCAEHGISHLIVDLEQDQLDTFAHNPPDRCYHCKKQIFSKAKDLVSTQFPQATLVDGTNSDDMSDYRPGHKALNELGIISPLKSAGFTKADIRRGLKEMNIEIWDKPAFACLASRIPYGSQITQEKLTAVYNCEKALKELGFTQLRVRHHGNLARIEVAPDERKRFFDVNLMDRVNEIIKSFGFLFVTLDLAGYKVGSLNQEIK